MARAFLNLEKSTSGCRREDDREFHKSEQVKRGEIVPERWQTLGKEREINDWSRVIDCVRAFDWPRTENSFVIEEYLWESACIGPWKQAVNFIVHSLRKAANLKLLLEGKRWRPRWSSENCLDTTLGEANKLFLRCGWKRRIEGVWTRISSRFEKDCVAEERLAKKNTTQGFILFFCSCATCQPEVSFFLFLFFFFFEKNFWKYRELAFQRMENFGASLGYSSGYNLILKHSSFSSFAFLEHVPISQGKPWM